MNFPQGQEITIVGTFRDRDGALADPTVTKLLVLRHGDSTWTTYTGTGSSGLTHPSTGRYERVIVLDAPGRWYYRWQGTGDVKAATPDTPIDVLPTRFTPQ